MENFTRPPVTLDAALALHARQRPTHAAILSDGRQVTYGRLHEESGRCAQAIRAAGLAGGARVAYLGKETEHYYEALFACARSGAVLVPVNWRLTADEVEYILRDSGTELLFVTAEHLDVAKKVRSLLPDLRTLVLVDCADQDGIGLADWKSGAAGTISESFEPSTDDAVVQLYTSGTTGFPKGVVLAHRSFFAVRDALADAGLDWVDWHADDKSLISIPPSHVGGLWWAVQGFNAGVTNVTVPVFSGKAVTSLLRDVGITVTCVVPAMLRMLLAEPEVRPEDFVSLRKIVYGGSPVSPDLLQRCMDLTRCELVQFYGLTETGNTAVCLPPADHVLDGRRLLAAGRPYPGFELKIIDDKGERLVPGAVGEICLKTPGRMLEYWRLPSATEAVLVDGWIHTGDAGYIGEDGYLFVQDRIKDMIIRAGEKIYPAEIEGALCAHPAVAEAVVIGIPDERWGEAVHAFVALAPGQQATPGELRRFLRERLADFKIPTGYEFIEKVPRNPTGKILRRTLRDRFWEQRARKVN